MEMEASSKQIDNPVGFWRRLGASLLDALIIGVPLAIILYLINLNSQNNLVSNVVTTLYSVLLPAFWSGYTVGKRIVGIRIVKVNGEEVGLGTMLLRVIVGMSLIYGITLGIAAIVSAFMVVFREDKRAIHDLIAGTYVTSNRP